MILHRFHSRRRAAVGDKRVDFAYDAAGQFTDIDRYDDLAGGSANLVAATDFVFDQRRRLSDLTHFEGAATIADDDWDQVYGPGTMIPPAASCAARSTAANGRGAPQRKPIDEDAPIFSDHRKKTNHVGNRRRTINGGHTAR